jgi:hypothetical protein
MYPFTQYFKGFEKVAAVREVFGEKTDRVLSNLMVEFAGIMEYMGVSELDGQNAFTKKAAVKAGLTYRGVGKGRSKQDPH